MKILWRESWLCEIPFYSEISLHLDLTRKTLRRPLGEIITFSLKCGVTKSIIGLPNLGTLKDKRLKG